MRAGGVGSTNAVIARGASLAALLIAACSGPTTEQPPPDAPPDALPDAPPDALPDAPPDAPPPPSFLSCKELAKTCGPGGDGDCCASLAVVGGTFYRSYDQADDERSGDKSAPATVSAFRLDRYEITVGRFRAFMMAGQGIRAAPPGSGAGAHPTLAGSGWDAAWNLQLMPDRASLAAALKCNPTFATWTDAPGPNESRPINCLSWYEAAAFCAWDGGFLPTEAEWNHAAAGGEQRAYPWSSPASSLAITPAHASYHDGTTCIGDGQAGCAVTDLVPVGSRPAGDGRWGQADLAGNVWEWMLDWHGDVYQTPCVDCAKLDSATDRELRGGSFFGEPIYMRAGGRNYYPPAWRLASAGARCARKPE